MANPVLMNHKQIIDIVKYRWFWLGFSLLLIVPCIAVMIYSMITYESHTPLKVGIDFTGGTILQYSINEDLTPDKMTTLRNKLVDTGIKSPIIQNINNASITSEEGSSTVEHMVAIKTSFIEQNDNTTVPKITSVVEKEFGNASLIQTNSVGPTLGKELLKNSMTALALAFLGIVIYISFRFQFDYAVIAIMALFHDAIFIIGSFSFLSLIFNTQVDGLFITAVLTVIGFSIHDTIVVFDRIRENNRFLFKKCTFDEIVNASVNQTLARSINTSLSTLLTLLALYFFGGSTTKDFVLVMILGIIIGTYSSIFFASTLLALWHDIQSKKV